MLISRLTLVGRPSRRIVRSVRQPSTVQSTSNITNHTDAPAPVAHEPPKPAELEWKPVKDPNSGGIYYWNTRTNETTAVGAPNPSTAPATGGAGQGIMGTFAQSMVWGAGFSVANRLVGSVFSSFTGGDSGDLDLGSADNTSAGDSYTASEDQSSFAQDDNIDDDGWDWEE